MWPDRVAGSLGPERLDEAVADDARGMLGQGKTGMLHYGPDGERRRDELSVFVQSFAPAPRMLVFGAIDFASAVARMGHSSATTSRSAMHVPYSLPASGSPTLTRCRAVAASFPVSTGRGGAIDSRTVICVLTHDPKFDVPLLEVALSTDAGYIGAMGSRRTHEDRLARLREKGVPTDRLSRLASPIGLDIGARTPEGNRDQHRGRDHCQALGRQRPLTQ